MVLGIDASRAAGLRTGVGRALEHLLGAWSRQEHPFERVRVFAPSDLPDVPRDGRLHVEVLAGPSAGIWWQTRRLARAAKSVDVLFAPYTLPLGYTGRSVVSNMGVLEGRHALGGPRARARSRHMAWSARRADVVVANSAAVKADVVRFYGVPAERVVVVWPGVAPCFRPLRPGDEQPVAEAVERVFGGPRPFYLFVGKLSGRRHVPALLEAVARLRARRPEVSLLLVGPNAAGLRIEHLASRLGLTGAVRHVEFLDQETLALLYRAARAFVLPSEQEGFSYTIPEALASGCPVVTLRHDSLVEAGLHETALVLPDPSPESMAGALDLLAEDGGLHAELSRKGPEAVRGLTWDETARRTMEVLAAVASPPG